MTKIITDKNCFKVIGNIVDDLILLCSGIEIKNLVSDIDFINEDKKDYLLVTLKIPNYGFESNDFQSKITRNKKVKLNIQSDKNKVDPEILFDILGLIIENPPEIKIIKKWNDEEKFLACEWAGAVYLQASDNDDIEIPEKPDFLLDYN